PKRFNQFVFAHFASAFNTYFFGFIVKFFLAAVFIFIGFAAFFAGIGSVCNPRSFLLAHCFLTQCFILLFVLDLWCFFVWHLLSSFELRVMSSQLSAVGF